MAGDWIKMRTGLLTHPKVRRMASALKADKHRVIGGLFAVWCVMDEHTVDGLLEGWTLDAMDDELHWRGFGEAMQRVEWLSESPDGLQAPDFDEHMSKSAKRRALDADRKRADRIADPEAHGSWTPVTPPSASDADANADAVRTREEQEKNKKNTPPPLAAPPTNPNPQPKPKAGSKKAPRAFALTPELCDWANANAPNVDATVETEKFRDHTFKTAITDFDGAWRNWMRNAAQYAAERTRNGAKPHQTTAQRNLEGMRLLGIQPPGDIVDA